LLAGFQPAIVTLSCFHRALPYVNDFRLSAWVCWDFLRRQVQDIGRKLFLFKDETLLIRIICVREIPFGFSRLFGLCEWLGL